MAVAAKLMHAVELQSDLWACLEAAAKEAAVPVNEYLSRLIADHFLTVGAGLTPDDSGSRPIQLSAEGAARLVEMLEHPPEPTPAMRELVRRHGNPKTGTDR